MMTETYDTKTWFCLSIISMAVLTFGCANKHSFSKSSSYNSKPNIILIMADDLGYGELGSYGQELVQTPHLDSMAEEGMRFTSFYSGSTVCAPSRNVLMTGRHTGHTLVRGNYHTGEWPADLTLPDSTRTIAEYLKGVGYKTAMIGKWGLGDEPNKQGFDYSLAYLDQIDAHSYYPLHLWENEQKLPLEGNIDDKQGTYSHNVFVDKTLEYIRSYNSDEPFFMYLPYTIPHGRFEPPEDTPYTAKDWPQQQKNIAAMITRLDRDIGRILQLLEEKGIAGNTLVLFTSDNGPTGSANQFFNSNGPLRGIKRDLYEGGIRVPLIAWWPGTIHPGQTSDHVAAAWDLLPTFTELAGIELPAGIDGVSFVPELLGKEQPEHEFLYWEYYHYNWSWGREDHDGRPRNWLAGRAVRYGKWKAVTGDTSVDWELYNLENDLGETYNVVSDHPEIIRKIKKHLATCCNTSPYFPYEERTQSQ